MADGRHLEKSKIGHISGTVWPIFAKFGAVTQIGPPNRTSKLTTFKNPTWTAVILKIENRPYLRNGSTKFGMRTHINLVISGPEVEISKFLKSKMADSRHLENRKSATSLENGLADLRKIWHGDANWSSESDWKLKFLTFENPRWRTAAIFEKWKIGHRTISINAKACSCQKCHTLSRKSRIICYVIIYFTYFT